MKKLKDKGQIRRRYFQHTQWMNNQNPKISEDILQVNRVLLQAIIKIGNSQQRKLNEKMLCLCSNQGNKNKNISETPFHTLQTGKNYKIWQLQVCTCECVYQANYFVEGNSEIARKSKYVHTL